jgi:hypothetical protein
MYTYLEEIGCYLTAAGDVTQFELNVRCLVGACLVGVAVHNTVGTCFSVASVCSVSNTDILQQNE